MYEENSPKSSPAEVPAAVPSANGTNTVIVFVCDSGGTAQPVKVPSGTMLMDVVRAAFQSSTFKKGDFFGLEDDSLTLDQEVTTADAPLWTAKNPLKIKFKREKSCQIL